MLHSPYYLPCFLLETRSLYFSPNADSFLQGVGEIIGDFRDTVLSVVNLVPDGYFDAFTRPVINGKSSGGVKRVLEHLCPSDLFGHE